ncbi:FMN-binding protein [Cellulomonas denverensis]|uniref:FMN-binding protein n=1 Tax=Cellulomonas denverensis TaxID=264297 RepID=A0A7X6R008_9CELL|nr:FMN-binding protein [Cellulomonas denverensis]NKY23753.1 FMN-binding protein [Cellulomonas denverensis]GIG25754.1 hypothetical protein Cde04nite_19980 [Cellulomonas denverensis]
MNRTTRRHTFAVLSGLSVAVALAACSNADAVDSGTDTGSDTGSTDSGSTDSGSTGSGSTGSGDYTDGTYTAEGSYSSPGGQETIGVEVTVADGTVTAVTVTPEATSGNAARFQEDFAEAISDQVVGQELAGLSVDKVSGSSLTGDGFNAALDQIRADAAA